MDTTATQSELTEFKAKFVQFAEAANEELQAVRESGEELLRKEREAAEVRE